MPHISAETKSIDNKAHLKTVRWCLAAGDPMASQFFAVEFSGVSTVCLAHIVVDRYSRGYNVYSKAIGQMLASQIQVVLDEQKNFVVEFSVVVSIWRAHIIDETHFPEDNCKCSLDR